MASIRLARPEDRAGIDKITKEFSSHEYSHAPQYFDDAIATQKVFVAVENEQIIGYLIYHILWGNTPFLELLRVTSPYQRKGIGSQLLTALVDKLKTDGYNQLVSSSEEVNEIGNAFHKNQEFDVIGKLNMIYGKEIFYLKKLS